MSGMSDVADILNDANDFSSDRKDSDLLPLVQKGFLKVGDIVALKHRYTSQSITVEKDALVRYSKSNLLQSCSSNFLRSQK